MAEKNDKESREDDTTGDMMPVFPLRSRVPMKSLELEKRPYGIANDKVNNCMAETDAIKIIRENPEEDLKTSCYAWPPINKRKKKNSHAYVNVQLLIPFVVDIRRPLKEADFCIMDAVSNICYYAQRQSPGKPVYVTIPEIWRYMAGKMGDFKAKPSEKSYKAIRDRLDYMRMTTVKIDLKDELEKNEITIKDGRLIDGEIEDYVIDATKAKFTTDRGQELTGYIIRSMPVLYSYSRQFTTDNENHNHILYVNYSLFDIAGHAKLDLDTFAVMRYMIRQIELIKNGILDSHRILLDTLYEKCFLKTPEQRAEINGRTDFSGSGCPSQSADATYIRKQKARDVKKVEGILNAWTDKGWISGYSLTKKGKSVRGFDIDISERDIIDVNFQTE